MAEQDQRITAAIDREKGRLRNFIRKRVADDFRYSSDLNPEWLKPEQLRAMLTDKD